MPSTIFDRLASRWAEDASKTRPSEVPPTLYHYTDAAGLVGMLSNHSIWATDYRFLNDKSELEHTRALATTVLAHAATEGSNTFADDLIRHIEDYRKGGPLSDAFVFSLSEEEDDLSQWRGYAREGLGFTIGFSGAAIHKAAEDQKRFAFFRVDYDHQRQSDIIKRAFEEFNEAMQKELKKKNADQADLTESAASNFDWMIETRAAANKHKSFRTEKEWRLLAYVPKEDSQALVKVRASGTRLVNYTELGADAFGGAKLPITRIGVGPGFVNSNEADAVRALCGRFGYDVEIYPADTPYRRV